MTAFAILHLNTSKIKYIQEISKRGTNPKKVKSSPGLKMLFTGS